MQAFLQFLPSLAESATKTIRSIPLHSIRLRRERPRSAGCNLLRSTKSRGGHLRNQINKISAEGKDMLNPNMSIRQRTCFVRHAERCVSQCDVDMLFALNVRCFELFKVQSEAMRYSCLQPLTFNLQRSTNFGSIIGVPTNLVGEWGERRHMSPNDAEHQSSRLCCRTRVLFEIMI